MGTYGDPITQGSIPAVGTAGTAYATNLDLFLTEVGNRLQSKVPLTSLQAGTFDLANNPLNNAQWAALYPQGVQPSSPVGSLQNFNNDIWWVSGSGAVQITSGATINSANIGGITGDYGGANPAQFRYSVANLEYTAYTNFSTLTYGKVWASNFDLAAATTGSTRVRLDATGVGSSYTLNVPTALPAATAALYLTTAGSMVYSRTITYHYGPLQFKQQTFVVPSDTSVVNSTAFPAQLDLSFPVGTQITGIRCRIKDNATGPTKMNFEFRSNTDGGADTIIGTAATSTGAGTTQTLTLSPTTTMVTLNNYYVQVNVTTGSASMSLYGAEVDVILP